MSLIFSWKNRVFRSGNADCSLQFFLNQNLKGSARSLAVGKKAIAGRVSGEGAEKVALTLTEDSLKAQGLAPPFQIVKRDIGGQVGVTCVLVKVGTGESFLEKISTQGAAQEPLRGSDIVDGENLPSMERRQPMREPMMIAFVNLDSLVQWVVFFKKGRLWKALGGEKMFAEIGLRSGEVELRPTIFFFAKNADGEGIH